MSTHDVTIVGAGLSGCEAAWQLAQRGLKVRLYEMRPLQKTLIHKTDDLAELVCSNSFKSLDPDTAAGSLKSTLASMQSLLFEIAGKCQVAAGSALAVDRALFSSEVTHYISSHPNIDLVREEVLEIPEGEVIVATGPLTSERFVCSLEAITRGPSLAFYDAAAPIVEAESLDFSRLTAQSRYDKGGADYLNAFMDRSAYDMFYEELVSAERVIMREFEQSELFNACQPIEQIARSGHDAMRFGALKPVGLYDPATDRRPWAAVQLRAENADKTAYNLVGFQTNLKFSEQERVFRLIPGLESAEFSRFGVMHRNTFLDSPHALDRNFALPDMPRVRFAGQITGTEGYLEAVASGLFAALSTYAHIKGLLLPQLPRENVLGALFDYATDPNTKDYQPMHVNYGILPPALPPIKNKRDRYAFYAKRSNQAIHDFVSSRPDLNIEQGSVLSRFVGESDA